MRVLITGCSSLTGAAFAKSLHESGMQVTAAVTRPRERYSGLQSLRLSGLPEDVQVAYGGMFGTRPFVELMQSMHTIDALLFHHAHVGDHRSPTFDVQDSVERTTTGLREVLRTAIGLGTRLVVITRSMFESGQGGSRDAPPASGYGLAKTLISERVREGAHALGLQTKEFVIPNPVGPLEKPGLSSHLAQSWRRGEVPLISSPYSERDFVPVDLLANAYVQSVRDGISGQTRPCSPSLWPLSVSEWASRLASEFGSRLGAQLDICVDRVAPSKGLQDRRVGRHQMQLPRDWSEEAFWNSYLEYFTSSSDT